SYFRVGETRVMVVDTVPFGCFPRNFFFSSRRRHTRFSRDWSSDVCSSDLKKLVAIFSQKQVDAIGNSRRGLSNWLKETGEAPVRSEERRVGKEWRARGMRSD